MSVPIRLAAFAAVLGLAFGGAALAGAAVDPTQEEAAVADAGHGEGQPAAGDAAPHGGEHGSGEVGAQPAAERHGAHGGGGGAALSGLAVSEGGYAFEIDRGFLTADETAPFTFRITDERGRVVRDDFELEHDKQLHLIVVRRDTAIFETSTRARARTGRGRST